MPRDRYPNLEIDELLVLLNAAQSAKVRGSITGTSAAGISTSRNSQTFQDVDRNLDEIGYSLYVRSGGADPRYPNPYIGKVTRTRMRLDTKYP